MSKSLRKYINYLPCIWAFLFIIWGLSLYSASLRDLWHQWQTQEYGHGLLLPFISVWWSIYLLQKTPIRIKSTYLGLIFILGALTLNSIGMVISNHWISNISMIVFLVGVVWAFLGFAIIKRIYPAIFLLFFAIPLPVTILPSLTSDLQLLSSSFGVKILHLLEISAFQEGNIIDLGGHKLDVDIACSGLQYLFPLLSLSYLIAFFSFESWWKRGALFISAIPITLGMNAGRIALTGILYNLYGSDAIEGILHSIEGYMIFALCLMVLFIVKIALDYLPPYLNKDNSTTSSFSFQKLTSNAFQRPSIYLLLAMFIIFSFFTGLSAFISSHHNSNIELSRKHFYDFPLVVGNWTGTKLSLPEAELKSLNLSDYFSGNYHYEGNSFNPINFYIAYYNKQTQQNSIHSPQICLPGSGWVILSREIYDAGPVEVNMEVMQKGNQKLLVYYWFREAGVDAATSFDIKKLLLINSFRSGRTDGSLIRLTTQLNEGDRLSDVQNQMDDFLKNVFPSLPEFIPAPKKILRH